ncbi:MAG: hypothetical protein FH759_03425 [Sediminimonas qiaohouensis]|uniref:Uncharacterized protein n=1 Tax=Sediminimonas qiaohouensis TaxID=552061 RepID=A0A7C9L7H0_9RHOB|nr:hypothetical protein [Sediminimonas qiaohouensis]MTJ03734.1 hypothetical protein [Sediminimonas qiaohouensis]
MCVFRRSKYKRGAAHPAKPTIRRKHNPLQRPGHLFLKLVTNPATWLTGIFAPDGKYHRAGPVDGRVDACRRGARAMHAACAGQIAPPSTTSQPAFRTSAATGAMILSFLRAPSPSARSHPVSAMPAH